MRREFSLDGRMNLSGTTRLSRIVFACIQSRRSSIVFAVSLIMFIICDSPTLCIHAFSLRGGNSMSQKIQRRGEMYHLSFTIQPRKFQNSLSKLDLSATTQRHDNNNSSEQKKKKKKLSRPERKALERKKKQKHKNNEEHRYSLHSRKVSVLCKSQSTADDVVTAIKRAQNRHDVHDIRNIGEFLLNEVDASFAYGFRGSLLARLAVAALHMSEHDSARRAIEVRKKEHNDSILPMESAAIIRGLLRVHNVTDAMSILQDELALPEKVSET